MNLPVVALRDETELRRIAEHLPHALLIIAEEGLESEQVLEWLAVHRPSELIHIVPLEKKTTISVEQIRDLQQSVRTQPTTRRVIIIAEAQLMTESASNALLKLLEEPGQGTHFILATPDEELLLPTIRSRCQSLTLHRTTPAQDTMLLAKSVLTDAEKQQLLFLAAGRPRLIRELSRQPKRFAEYRQFATDAKQLLGGGDTYATLCTLHGYMNDRQKALRLIDVLVHMIRFQMTANGCDERVLALLERAEQAETALKGNGNVRLALLQLVN